MIFRDNVTIDSLSVVNEILVMGELTILGSASTINTTNLVVDDPIILLSSGQTGSPVLDSGFFVNRGTGATQGFIWDESTDEFALIQTSNSHETIGNVVIDSYSNLRLGSIGVNGAPSATTTAYIKGIDSTSSNFSLKIESASASSLFNVRNDGYINMSNNSVIIQSGVVTFLSSPIAPTTAFNDNSVKVATTEFVQNVAQAVDVPSRLFNYYNFS